MRHLKERGLAGVQLITSDACLGLVEAAAELFPEAQWQRCVVHFYRNVFSQVPKGKVAEVARMLKAIHAQEDRGAAEDKVREVTAKLRAMRLPKAAELVEAKAHEHASRVIGDWVGFYNQRRPHQALGMRTPEQAYLAT